MTRSQSYWGAALFAVASLVLAGCDRKVSSAGAGPGSTGGESSKGGAGSQDHASTPVPAVAAWTKAGLTVSAFTKDQSGKLGSDCQSGTVSGLDVVVCKFGSEQAAHAAEANGLSWVGEATGAAIAGSSYLVAVADRRKADPSGRTINQIMKLFRDTSLGSHPTSAR